MQSEDLPPGSSVFRLSFVPERWPPFQRFRWFIGPPFPTVGEPIEALMAISAHLGKYETLAGLADRLAEELPADQAELDREGFTPAIRSREFVAVSESLACELYAALDGLKLFLYVAYRHVPGIQRKKTSVLFKKAAEGSYGPGFPTEIQALLAAAYASWFPKLRALRTTITHGLPGSAWLDRETGNVRYIHSGLSDGPRPFVVDDMVGHLNDLCTKVRELLDGVFSFLLTQLSGFDREVMCGVYKARIYQRTVAVGTEITRESGRCLSRQWFETKPGYECPLRGSCRAYEAAGESTPSPSAAG